MTEKIELSEGTIDDPIGLAVFSASATEAPLRPELKFATEPMIMPYHDKNLPKPQTFCHGFLERLTP